MSDSHLKLENQICHSLYSATNALVRAYRPLLEKLDLTYPQYLTMMALWDGDSVMIKDLVDRTRFDAGSLTPILKRLESKDLIELKPGESDARQKSVVLTNAGKDLKSSAKSVPQDLMCQVDLSLDDALALKALSEKLYASLSATD